MFPSNLFSVDDRIQSESVKVQFSNDVVFKKFKIIGSFGFTIRKDKRIRNFKVAKNFSSMFLSNDYKIDVFFHVSLVHTMMDQSKKEGRDSLTFIGSNQFTYLINPSKFD